MCIIALPRTCSDGTIRIHPRRINDWCFCTRVGNLAEGSERVFNVGGVWIVYSTRILRKKHLHNYYATSFHTLDFQARGSIQSKSIKEGSYPSWIFSWARRLAGMRRYAYSLLSTSTKLALREFKTFILGTLPMFLTITDLNPRKTFISLSKCLCY